MVYLPEAYTLETDTINYYFDNNYEGEGLIVCEDRERKAFLRK